MSKFTATLFMPVRYRGLSYLMYKVFLRKALSLFFIFSLSLSIAQTTDELKKQADKLFKDENYDEAYKYYSQLVSNFPKDPEYNYRLGVCMIYSEADKTKCLPYLKLAAANPNDAPKEVLFYLGRAYHINYRFDEAIRHYNEFKKIASASLQKKLMVDREIIACNNGKKLLSNFSDLVVLNKKELPKQDYFRSYEMKKMGKLLVKPDEFKTATDKKKKENSIVFLPSKSDVIYYSSYGEDPATGKDIYTSRKVNGAFTKPEKVKTINTEFDEDYPFLHPDGKTLYFASKGFNSMGGYDIFRSTFNEATQTWNAPVNLEFPVNSPDDDYLYVTDSLETMAYFSTGRQSSPGKIDVLKVKTKRRAMDVIGVKGNVKAGQVDHSLASTIIIKDAAGDREFGRYTANDQGEYLLEVPSASKLLFTVETPGLETQSAAVTIPATESIRPLKQIITYESGKLKIENLFDETATDDSYLDYLNVIEKKAKLEPSTGADATETAGPLAATTPGATPTAAAPEKPAGMNNKELAAMARKDADESRQEALQLSEDSRNASEAGNRLSAEADRKKLDAEKLRNGVESLTDETLKEIQIKRADSLSLASDADAVMASKVLALANGLAEDANRKEKEANLNEQYSKELERAITSKSPESMKKLSDLQKQIEELASKENVSTSLIEGLKADLAAREKELVDLNQANALLGEEIADLNKQISTKEEEIAAAKKKKEKERLGEELENLKLDKSEKEGSIAANNEKINQANNDLTNNRNELSIATSLRDPSKLPTPKPIKTDASAKELRDYYGARIVVEDNNDKVSVQSSINALNQYNLDLEAALERSKSTLAELKTAAEKQNVGAEIKSLEADIKLNQTRLSANFNRLTELNKIEQKDKVALENSTTYRPIKADNPLEALSLINELNADLKESEAELFGIQYRDKNALSLRDEANAKLTASTEKQNKVLEDINLAKENLQKVDTTAGPAILLADSLLVEGDRLSAQAQALRDKSQKAKAAEKEKLLAEAKILDEKSTAKHLQASEINSKDNTAIIAANRENIQNLLKLGRAPENDALAARKLNDESVTSFRKAVEIRTEAKALPNLGSRLGGYSNAEDLESEAILKQQQAIELLMRSAGDFNLKTVVTSTTLAKQQSEKPQGMSLEQALAEVNAGVVELGNLKLESYRKLYDANAAEISALKTAIDLKVPTAQANPVLKTDFMNARKMIAYSVEFKASSDASKEPNDQFNYLLTAIRQQNLAQQKLAEVKFGFEKAERQQKSPAVTTEVVGAAPDPTIVPVPSSPKASEEEPVAVETPKQTETKPVEETNAAPLNPEEELKSVLGDLGNTTPDKAKNENLIDIQEVANADTTSEQIIGFLNSNSRTLKNEEASALVQNSLSKLKTLESDFASVKTALDQNEEKRRLADASVGDPAAMRKEADALLLESEELAGEAAEAKKEASRAKGQQKEALLSEARELEKRSKEKTNASIKLIQNAFEIEYKTNDAALLELLSMLEKDDQAKASELRIVRDEFPAAKQKINVLRDEASRQENEAAKLGAIGNAEEKESELLQNQTKLLNQLMQFFPAYVVKPLQANAADIDTLAEGRRKAIVDDQYTQMINLTNGYSLEYETAKISVPSDLSEEDEAIKKNADELNAESKRLLIASALEADYNRRMRLLALAAKYGNYAIEQLAKVGQPKTVASSGNDKPGKIDFSKVQLVDATAPVVTGGTIKDDSPKDSKTGKKDKFVNVNTSLASSNSKATGITILKGNAYSNANPIPIDAPMEQGLVFRVQIGAFKTQIPNNAFRGLTPLNGETTRNGYIRYTAGNFQKVEGATAVKNDLRNLGYNDAFVVAYFNGKRVSLAEALNQMKEQGVTIDPNAPQTAGITANTNVPKANSPGSVQDVVTVTKQLENTKGLLYTIQVGVFNKQVSKTQLRGIKPVYSEALGTGLFRYTAGIYSSAERALADKAKVVELGLKDAFVSAYINGKRLPYLDAKAQQESDKSLRTESENPVSFPGASAPEYVTSPTPAQGSTVVPFVNNVSAYPNATPENGIQYTEEGVCYKVQLGAFKGNVPEDMAQKFNQIRTWPVEHKIINGMYVYTVGNFKTSSFAKGLRDEIKEFGLEDVYITVYKDGRKLGGQEAEDLLK